MISIFLKINFSFFLIISVLVPSLAQSATDVDTIYGSDPLLFNGRQYIYQVPPGSKGYPYLSGPEFQRGWINIAGRQYQHLNLNYDIVNQVLLLKYIDQAGFTIVIEISESWLTGFGIGESEFELRRQIDKPVIYQVIQSENVKVWYHWKKDLKLENVMTNAGYSFSTPRKTCFVIIQGRENDYKKNREFVGFFDPSIQNNISKFLKINKIKVNKASDASMRALVNYCNTLINP